ncbi:MAG: hypothetical protein AAGI37_16375 [Planctomycetota bacterium]
MKTRIKAIDSPWCQPRVTPAAALFRFACYVLLIAATATAQAEQKKDDLEQQLDTAIRRAIAYLEEQQDDRGAWPSETYGLFRDGVALTPHVLRSLTATGRNNDATDLGFKFIHGLLTDQKFTRELELSTKVKGPVYFSADTLLALQAAHEAEQKRRHIALYRLYHVLESLQIKTYLNQEYAQFGGWGYGTEHFKAEAGGIEWITSFDHGKAQARIAPQLSANISATVYALDMLAPQPLDRNYRDSPGSNIFNMLKRSRQFAARCQNFGTGDDGYDDGGFFFNPADAARNKGGPAGTDKDGYARFYSAGSSTADGLRVLLLCRVPKDDPALIAARDWLFKYFDPDQNPGTFNEDREVLRDAYYFYYAASVADTFTLLGDGPENWSQELAAALINRQTKDGSFANSFTDGKEDDPLIATPFALRAMQACRNAMAD